MRSRVGPAVAILAVAALVSSCAPKLGPPIPEGEDFVYPIPAAEQVSAGGRRELEKAWRRVLAGDVRAVGDYQKILSRQPDLVAAQTGLAYAHLRNDQTESAATAFHRVLEGHPEYLSALVGAGSTAFRRGDVDGALVLYRRALDVAPDDPVVRKRSASLKLQVTERHMAAAEGALDSGDEEAAALAYQAALDVAPEVAGVRLALADLFLAWGEGSSAVATLRADPFEDRQVQSRLGEILLGQGEYAQALDVYRALLAREPGDPAARQGERQAREALAFQSQPDQYRQIGGVSRARRADLAGLLVVKVTALGRLEESRARVAVDVSGSWAREQIARVIGLGIMDVYPNHTFLPQATVRRGDLARAVSRVLERLNWRPGVRGAAPTDMRPSHFDYAAVVTAVGARLMKLRPDGTFEPLRPVSGREAVEVVGGLARLVGS